jgi:hypothetical protein
MNLANPKIHEVTDTSSIDAISESLQTTQDYLLETVLGSCFLTGSRDLNELATREALALHVDWAMDACFSFTPERRDLPAYAMTYTAGLLSRTWNLTIGNCIPVGSLNLYSSDSDKLTARRVAMSPFPARTLSDCGFMRHRIEQVAKLLPAFDGWRGLARYLGRCGGPAFEDVARSLTIGGAAR